jgi:uncharacterized protein (TIGR00255 family)
MTGFGEAQRAVDGLMVRAEIRAVNSRHLKLSCRLPDGYAALEPRIDTLIKNRIRRGTIQLTLQVEQESSADDYHINSQVLLAYHQQLSKVCGQLDATEVSIDRLLLLPGVVDEAGRGSSDLDEEWEKISVTIEDAISHLEKMRVDEGRAMERDLRTNCERISEELGHIRKRAPGVVAAYQARLTERIKGLLADNDVQTEIGDIVREVGIFSDRVDISEEAVRLQSHLEQFDEIMTGSESSGRKLDFLIQEMFREVNTIGSKANDAVIARHVVQIKTNIERLREMVQNVE